MKIELASTTYSVSDDHGNHVGAVIDWSSDHGVSWCARGEGGPVHGTADTVEAAAAALLARHAAEHATDDADAATDAGHVPYIARTA